MCSQDDLQKRALLKRGWTGELREGAGQDVQGAAPRDAAKSGVAPAALTVEQVLERALMLNHRMAIIALPHS